MKTIGVREFRDHLSQYLREVEAGMTLLVADRGKVLAMVRPIGSSGSPSSASDARYWRAVEQGRVLPASRPDDRSFSEWPGAGLSEREVLDVLDEVRGE